MQGCSLVQIPAGSKQKSPEVGVSLTPPPQTTALQWMYSWTVGGWMDGLSVVVWRVMYRWMAHACSHTTMAVSVFM